MLEVSILVLIGAEPILLLLIRLQCHLNDIRSLPVKNQPQNCMRIRLIKARAYEGTLPSRSPDEAAGGPQAW
jgi:hypothetical protein